MKVCDSCSVVVDFLLDKTIAVGLKDGDWALVHAELCTRCAQILDRMEIEARDHATLKAHKQFMEQMNGYETFQKRPAKRIPAYP